MRKFGHVLKIVKIKNSIFSYNGKDFGGKLNLKNTC